MQNLNNAIGTVLVAGFTLSLMDRVLSKPRKYYRKGKRRYVKYGGMI
jgi:hypothetical protein